jgi:PPOX class probable F420-dependent enzyme
VALTEGIRAFVVGQRVARLATVDTSGRPHVVPICFALGGDILYTVIDEKPKTGNLRRLQRLRNIEHNPHVQVLLDVYNDRDWSQLRFVQLRGNASVIEVGAEYEAGLRLLRARYQQYDEMALEGRPLIAVNVIEAVAWPP